MALKKCRECNNSVSSTAMSCPQCGAVLKRKTGCFTKFVLFCFIMFSLAVLSLAFTDPQNLARSRRTSSNAGNVSKGALATQWTYTKSEDKMSGRRISQATIRSTNEVNFDFPYSGKQKGRLSIRNHPRFGDDIIFSIDRGQLVGDPLAKKTATVRFDDTEPIEYALNDSNDHGTTTVFFVNNEGFYSKLVSSNRVRISIPVYQEGNPIFEFDVSKFDKDQFKPSGN